MQQTFQVRPYQLNARSALDKGYLRLYTLWHRRSGKDLTWWDAINSKAVQKTGLYYYFLPTYAQAKKIIWDGITNDGHKFLDYIPQVAVENLNHSEMKISYKNGSLVQLIGTDNYDAIRGSNPCGCVFSEFAYQNPQAWEVVKPILKINGGWAAFDTTPNGKNFAYDIWQMALENPFWFKEKLTIRDTGILSEQDIAQERAEGMTEEMIQQEYYCSFSVGTLGAYYSQQLQYANENKHICPVAWEPNVKVNLWLDLGRNDTTSIIFTQTIGNEIRVIDHLEQNGQTVNYYAKELDKKPYRYGIMYLPHDATHKRMESDKTIQEQFVEAGFRTEIVKKLEIMDGIQQARKIFPRVWFDAEKTKQLIRALENYHKEWDNERKTFKPHPYHDWSSNSADAFRYLAVGHEDEIKKYEKPVNHNFDKYEPF